MKTDEEPPNLVRKLAQPRPFSMQWFNKKFFKPSKTKINMKSERQPQAPNGETIGKLLLPESYQTYRDLSAKFKSGKPLTTNEVRELEECLTAIFANYPKNKKGNPEDNSLALIPEERYKVLVGFADSFRQKYTEELSFYI